MKKIAARYLLPLVQRLGSSGSDDAPRRARISGNVFFAVFAAVLMVGAVGYGFNTVLRGPISGMTDVTRHTVAESTLVTSSRLAIIGATTHQAAGGDCDADGQIEPLPYFDAGTSAHPTNGGWLPRGPGAPPSWTLVPSSLDPWKTEYGYCAWDSGTAIAAAGCGGSTGRLAGSPGKNTQSFVIISAGKNKKFETTCNAYNAATPNALLYTKANGSDDIILGYTYSEANDVGNGLWKGTNSPTTTVASTDKNLEVKGTGTFAAPIKLTAGGLVLPDSTTTGACNAANDRQMRRNMTDPASPVIEVCDFTGGLDWSPISGTSGGGGGGGGGGSTGDDYAGLSGTMIARWPLDESSGTTAFDSRGSNNGTLTGSPVPTWSPSGGIFKGALTFNGTTQAVRIKDQAYLHPSTMTISLWVKSTGAQPANAIILDKVWEGGAGPTYHTVSLQQDNTTQGALVLFFSHPGDFDWINLNQGGYSLPQNKWVNLVLIMDSTQTKITAYADGTIVGQGSNPSWNGLQYGTQADKNDWYIGYESTSTASWNGSIDDVRIYNYALSDDEVQAIYKAGVSGLNTPISVKKGPVYAWGGDDTNGALGNGSSFNAGTTGMPQAILATPDFVQLSGADRNACGVKADRTVWCWGENSNRTTGNAAAGTTNQQTPVKTDNITNAIKVATGPDHTCAVKADGTIWCWGNNAFGELGNGTTNNSGTAVQVQKINDFIDVTVNERTSCGIRADGTAWCWGADGGSLGCNNCGDKSIPVQVLNVTDFASFFESVDVIGNICAITRRGINYCWGSESSNTFGNGSTTSEQDVPSPTSNITDFVKVSASADLACGLRATGQIACWGDDDGVGQLGNGPSVTAGQTVPYTIPNISDFTDVSVSINSACGLRRNGEAWCWGNGYTDSPTFFAGGPFLSLSGQNPDMMGILNTAPRKTSMALAKDRDRLAVAKSQGCFIDADKTAWCWGGNAVGQLGNGTTAATTASPSKVTLDGPWSSIAAGGNTASTNGLTCGIKDTGALYCWGADTNEGLGNGAGATNLSSPVAIGVANSMWSQVAVGANSACAINSADGRLWCWGDDTNSHTGGAGAKNIPTKITDKGPWQRVAMNGTNTCGIKQNGDLYCWGLNSVGQTGTGGTATADVTAPKIVNSPGPWIDISVARLGACGIKQNGTLWCWGSNTVHRQYGDTFSPILINDAGPWASVSAYETHVCGTKVDGSAWCFGTYNADGRQGNGTSANSFRPVRVLAGNDWTAIKTGTDHTCGIKSDNSVWCWGSDANGQLGNGAVITANQITPNRVALAPKSPAFSWNTNGTSYSPPTSVNLVVGTTRSISNNGTGTDGLRLLGTGRSSLTQTAAANQFLLDAQGNNAPSQLLFKSASATPAADNISGLVSRWKLDESTGTTATDSVSGFNGTINGSATWAPAGGKQAGGLTFANSGVQYVRVPRNTALEPPGSTISVALWIKPNGASDSIGCQVTKLHTNDLGGYYISYAVCFPSSGNQIAFFTSNNIAGYGEYLTSATALPNNTWSHVVVTFDPSAVTPQKKIYINGVLNASETWTTPFQYDTTSPTGDLVIGTGVTTGPPYYQRFFGTLDDVRIYNRALTATEVTQLYGSYTAGTGANMMRTVGLNYISGNLEFSRNSTGADQWTQDLLTHDMEIDQNGNVGMGTTGQPLAKLDVNGAIRIGNNSSCGAGLAGTIDYNSGSWRYCTAGGTWATFGSWASTPPWQVGPHMIAGSGGVFCGIKQDGYLYCWGGGPLGNNLYTDSSVPIKVHDDTTSTGWADWIVPATIGGLRVGGTLWEWGYNSNGETGTNNIGTHAGRPVQVKDNTGSGTWTDWTAIGSDGSFDTRCGIRTNGRAYCWGINTSGAVGDGSTTNRGYPTSILDDTGVASTFFSDWKMISATATASCGLRYNGKAYCWGAQTDGHLGNGTTSAAILSYPRQVRDGSGTAAFWTDWVYISNGDKHACGIRTNGRLYCWGNNSSCRLGNNCATGNANYPQEVYNPDGTTNADNVPANSAITDWAQVMVGSNGPYGLHSCALRSSGALYCWGDNPYGELGNGTTTTIGYPVQVKDATGSGVWTDWVSVTGGLSTTCGQRSNGTTWCWGYGANGQLGNGGTSSSPLPVQVK